VVLIPIIVQESLLLPCPIQLPSVKFIPISKPMITLESKSYYTELTHGIKKIISRLLLIMLLFIRPLRLVLVMVCLIFVVEHGMRSLSLLIFKYPTLILLLKLNSLPNSTKIKLMSKPVSVNTSLLPSKIVILEL